MTPEDKQLWVAALRSGEYPKVKGNLKTDEGYCCLGVACEVFGIKIATDSVSVGRIYSALIDRFEVDAVKPFWTKNDIVGWDFNQIADWIEKEY